MAGVLWSRQSSKAPDLAGFRVQTSVYGLPIPVVYGTARVAGNLIDFVPGDAVPVQSQRSKWTSATQTGWSYMNAVALALCEGPIVGIGNVWADKDAKEDFDAVVQPRDLWTLKLGTLGQVALGYLSSTAPYEYIAYVAAEDYVMPNNVLPNLSWEVQGLFIFGSGVVDALGSDILTDILTDTTHGAAFPTGSLDSLSDYEDYCAAAGLFVSPAITKIQKVADIIDELMYATYSAVVWSDGLLKVVPYGDEALTAHGHTYTPNVNPIYDLSDVDYIAADGEDPVTVTRKNPNECYNQLFLEFENRSNDYNLDVKEAKDDESILATRLRPAPKATVAMIKDPDVARLVAQLQQQRAQHVVNQYHFKVGWKFSLLEPMDLITLTDSGLGLDSFVARLTEVVELEDGSGIEMTAEDWPFGAAGATLYPSEVGSGHKPAQNVAPGDTVATIVDAPPVLTNSYLGTWVGASGGVNWGGCEVWYSYDDVTYYKLGEIHEKAVFGVLTASLATNAPYPTVDTTHTMKVSTALSGGVVPDVSQDVFDAEGSLIWLNGEWLIYRDVALTGANAYDITHLGRGMYGSTIANPAANASPWMLVPPAFDATGNLNGSILRWNNPGARTGDVIYFKLPAFNVYGNALQSLADVTAIAHTVAAVPSLPGNGIAQGTVSIAKNGVPTYEIDGLGWTRSYKYLTSTSAFPTDAAVVAGGTIVDGRTQSIVDSALALGGITYATFIPYSGLQASGIAGKSMRISGRYMALELTKTTTFPANGYIELTSPPRGLSWDADWNVIIPTLVGGDQEYIGIDIPIPKGCIITSISFEIYGGSGGLGIPAAITCALIRMAGSTATTLGTNTAGSTTWSTVTIGSLSETASAGRSYQAQVGIAGVSVGSKIGNVSVTYTMPDLQSTY